MDLVALFLSAQGAFGDRVHAVREDQWHAPTPCRDWDVAALVNHVTDEDKWVPPLVHGLDLNAAGKVVEASRTLPVDGGVGANLVAVWDEAAIASADAFRADGALERSVDLSRGPTPARDYIGEMIFDHLVHAWDLGRAIGYDGPLPEDVVETVYSMAQGMGDLSAFGDMFAAPVAVPDDASTLDKLIGLTGRDPR
jgi:uncharacterized protein (TIGR03086 family)